MSSSRERYRAKLATMQHGRSRASAQSAESDADLVAAARKGPKAAAKALAERLGVSDKATISQMSEALKLGQVDRATAIAMKAIAPALECTDPEPELESSDDEAPPLRPDTDGSDEELPPPRVLSANPHDQPLDGAGATATFVPRCAQGAGKSRVRKRPKARRGKKRVNQ